MVIVSNDETATRHWASFTNITRLINVVESGISLCVAKSKIVMLNLTVVDVNSSIKIK